MFTVALVGSTGSIGTQAADVVRANPERFKVNAIGAHSSIDVLAQQANEFRPDVVALVDDSKASLLEARLPGGTELLAGPEALATISTQSDVVLNSVVGFAGLPVTLAALNAGKRLALANKESLIAAGPLVRVAKNTVGAELLPVDSEHGAIHQCLRSETPYGTADKRAVAKLVLTASGGPFRGYTQEQLAEVNVEDALNHPTWKMGPKITVDSSTLFNKGLEVIEAHELFDIIYDKIEVVVHPQSIVHSAVTFTDGSTIAQLSVPDMRLPIGYAMGHPQRLATPYGELDWSTLGSLTFEQPDRKLFGCLDLAFEAGRAAGTAPTWLNAANEVAVSAFLSNKVTWLQISSIIEEVLNGYDGMAASSVEAVLEADANARRMATAIVGRN